MGVLTSYETVQVRYVNGICFLQLDRPEVGNTINRKLVEECAGVVREATDRATVLVLEGLPDVFCTGADFAELVGESGGDQHDRGHAEALYSLWLDLATGPFVSVAHVRGKVNAGGVGFVAACDVVIAEEEAVFSLSELLFGVMPACVLPFLIRRTGVARANRFTVMTTPLTARQALDWGLVDACERNSADLLRRHLLRLRYLPKSGLARYKAYLGRLDDSLTAAKELAVAANHEVFTDPATLAGIERYVVTGHFPWEKE